MFSNCGAGENLKSLLDSKEIKPVNPKGNQPWLFIGRTDAEAEAPILWPADGKSRLTGKDPDAREDWGQEEKGTTEDEMVGWLPPTQWTWVWANSGRQWRTGKSGVLQSMGSQRVGHNSVSEQQQQNLFVFFNVCLFGCARSYLQHMIFDLCCSVQNL